MFPAHGMVGKNVYERSAYLSVINTHEIRNIFTRIRYEYSRLL